MVNNKTKKKLLDFRIRGTIIYQAFIYIHNNFLFLCEVKLYYFHFSPLFFQLEYLVIF